MPKHVLTPARAALIALLALAVGCGGSSSSPEAAPESSGGESESMTLDAFSAQLALEAAPSLCATDDAPLRTCFEIDAEQCTRAFTVAMTECANQLRAELPAEVDASNADATATTISQCAGQAYRLGLDQHGLVRQTPECQQPAS